MNSVKEIDICVKLTIMHDGVARIAGCEEHFQARAAALHLLRQRPAVHAVGKHDIGEYQRDVIGALQKPR